MTTPYINPEVQSEMKELASLTLDSSVSDQDILRRVSALDCRFEQDSYYSLNINGVIGNIGSDRKSLVILTNAIKRLTDLLIKAPESSAAKLTYDLANVIHSKANVLYPYPRTVHTLIAADEFSEALRLYRSVRDTPPHSFFPPAVTNAANIFDQFGRNYESVLLYDRALKIYPNFGMALGNKAKALLYYAHVGNPVPKGVTGLAEELLTLALQDSALDTFGGEKVRAHFTEQLEIARAATSTFETSFQVPTLTSYQMFCMERNLFLNSHFGFLVSARSLRDDILPPFAQQISNSNQPSGMSAVVHLSIRVYNQILEEYASARLQFFQVLREPLPAVDSDTNYIYTFSMARNGIKQGFLKSIYVRLFNVLDKIALIAFCYFEIFEPDQIPAQFGYDWFTKSEFTTLITRKEDFQLLALQCLAKDFKDKGAYEHLRRRRNLITHRFLDIHEVSPNSSDEHNVPLSQIIDDIENLFLISKASLFYLWLAVRRDSDQRLAGSSLPPRTAPLQSEFFSEFDCTPETDPNSE